MKVTRYDEPWTHLVVDDFIDEDTFAYLSSNYKSLFRDNAGRSVHQFDKLPDESSLKGKIFSSVVKIWDDYYNDINSFIFSQFLKKLISILINIYK